MLFNDTGADGLKTGHTSFRRLWNRCDGKENDRRLILVLNGLKSNRSRSKESQRLINIGFKQFNNILVANAGMN